MIKVSNKRSVRETTADYEYVDEDNQLKTAPIRVRYFSFTTAELKQRHNDLLAKIKDDPNYMDWTTDRLAERIESLPDLVDENGNAHKVSVEFLDSLEARNVLAIKKAIDEDIAPK